MNMRRKIMLKLQIPLSIKHVLVLSDGPDLKWPCDPVNCSCFLRKSTVVNTSSWVSVKCFLAPWGSRYVVILDLTGSWRNVLSQQSPISLALQFLQIVTSTWLSHCTLWSAYLSMILYCLASWIAVWYWLREFFDLVISSLSGASIKPDQIFVYYEFQAIESYQSRKQRRRLQAGLS